MEPHTDWFGHGLLSTHREGDHNPSASRRTKDVHFCGSLPAGSSGGVLARLRPAARRELPNRHCAHAFLEQRLVWTVQQTAVGVLEPSVLVDETSGNAYLIVLSLGRCVWGWPLRVENAEKMLLVMAHPMQALVPIVLTSPHLGPATPISPMHCPAEQFSI